MKLLPDLLALLVLACLLSTSCGRSHLESQLYDELGFCHAFSLDCGSSEDAQHNLDNTNSRIDQIGSLIYLNKAAIDLFSLYFNNAPDLVPLILDIQNNIANLQNQAIISTSEILALHQDILTLQNSSQDLIGVVDPCGDKPNSFDEVLLDLGNGVYVAYFESGNGQGNQKRHLAVLSDGNYVTTDSQQCQFSIVNGEYVESN